jgi:coenzyme F420 hydrogenase subunit beta
VSIQRSWAGDPTIRHRAAAGGTLTALGCYLLRSGEVDAVVHVKASISDPILTDAHVSYSPQEVIEGSQSRYGPAAPLVHVKALLDKGLRIAVIAKPCDVAAIRNLARIDARARAQVKYCLTLFCGGVPNTGTAKDIAAHFGVAPNELSVFRWRGYGWPGPTHLETKDGRSFDLSYDDAWYNPNASWTYDMQFRCKICPDAIGELADVSAPDGWVMENGVPIHKEGEGANIAIARTKAGAGLIERAVAAGDLVLDHFTVPELYPMHGDHLDRKLGQPARNLGLKCAGEPSLRVKKYRPVATVLRAGIKGNWQAFWGALRRARAGANRETGR